MNNFFKSIFLCSLTLFVVSCSKSDSSSEPLRDYTEQYNTDKANIETFMKTHYMEVVNHPGQTDDMDVTFTKIPTGGTQTSIWDQTDYPRQTHTVTVTQNEAQVTYDIYFLQLRQGTGKSPCNVDKVYTAYRGEYIFNGTEGVIGKEFEESIYPTYFNLYATIPGWSEIFPQFKTGSYVENTDGTITYSGFGAGVMFIPSGLGYYSSASGTIPSYSPLIFSFKLYEILRMDQDGDGILSYLEDSNGDGYVRVLAKGITNPDNTNEVAVPIPGTDPVQYYKKDILPDFLDPDDDGDYFLTKNEIKKPTGQAYPFADIPTCGGTGNGKKRHLDPTCHN